MINLTRYEKNKTFFVGDKVKVISVVNAGLSKRDLYEVPFGFIISVNSARGNSYWTSRIESGEEILYVRAINNSWAWFLPSKNVVKIT